MFGYRKVLLCRFAGLCGSTRLERSGPSTDSILSPGGWEAEESDWPAAVAEAPGVGASDLALLCAPVEIIIMASYVWAPRQYRASKLVPGTFGPTAGLGTVLAPEIPWIQNFFVTGF